MRRSQLPSSAAVNTQDGFPQQDTQTQDAYYFSGVAIIACVVLLSPPPRVSEGEGLGVQKRGDLRRVYASAHTVAGGARRFAPGLAEEGVGKKRANCSTLRHSTSEHLLLFAFKLTKTLNLEHFVGVNALEEFKKKVNLYSPHCYINE